MLDKSMIVNARQLLLACMGRIMPFKKRQQPGRNQLILDRVDTRRTFRMIHPHVVFKAGMMRDVSCVHDDLEIFLELYSTVYWK